MPTTTAKVLHAIAAVGFTLAGVVPFLSGREFRTINAFDLAVGILLFLGFVPGLRRRPDAPSDPGA